MSAPHANLMNGWDYVLAVTEDQINKGLRIAYDGGNVGTAFPQMPKGRFTLLLDDAGNRQLDAAFGCPSVHALYDQLKQCDLVIPLLNASVQERGVITSLPPDTRLIVTTALSSTGTSVGPDTAAGGPAGRHHEAFIDFKAPEAIYKVHLEDPQHSELRPRIAVALKKKLQEFQDRAFRVASFDTPAEANPFMPSRVDASFVRNAGQAGRNVVVFAASVQPQGAAKDNRLEFDAGILPLDLPAALWVGPGVVMERLVFPMLRQSLQVGAAPPNLRYDPAKGEVVLAERYAIGAVQGKSAVLEGLRAYAANGAMALHSVVRVYNVGKWRNAVCSDIGHIGFGLSKDGTALTTATASDSHNVQMEDLTPKFWRFLLKITGFAKWMQLVDVFASGMVGRVSIVAVNQKLQDAASRISGVTQKIPGLEDLAAGGHLVFDRVSLVDGSAAFLGIRATSVATQAPSAPRGLVVA